MVYHQKDSLSQNFIKHSALVTELLEVSDINKDDTVLEIGAGKGIITYQLCKVAKDVIAIEKDFDLAHDLIEEGKKIPNLKVIVKDFLEFNLPSVPYKIFSNIPFSITAKILHKILKSGNLPKSIYLIMQQETAKKFMGIPGETQSSVSAKPFYDIEILGDIDRTNFTLKPQVKIVFVQFKLKEKSFIKKEDKEDFFDFVIYGFNQWQPTVVESFKNIFSYNQLKSLKKIYKLGELKPSELSFDNWLLLFKSYQKIVTNDQKNLVKIFRKHYNERM
ncbi:MAG: 23S ribosomal RNA methyltransferase Erm [Candidatus Shapirobacteria bacterium]|nr:23S ribosomal RNA methyltransferase Erm [Candidatus Shapirobacteria bacterium]